MLRRRRQSRQSRRQSHQSRQRPPTGASHPMVGGGPRRKQPSQAADHQSAAVGGLQADLARAARDVAGKLGWRRARARGWARLSSQRERRQKPRWPAWVETSTAIQKFLQAAHARQARGAGSVAEARRAHSSAEGVSAGRRPPSASVCFAMLAKRWPAGALGASATGFLSTKVN